MLKIVEISSNAKAKPCLEDKRDHETPENNDFPLAK